MMVVAFAVAAVVGALALRIALPAGLVLPVLWWVCAAGVGVALTSMAAFVGLLFGGAPWWLTDGALFVALAMLRIVVTPCAAPPVAVPTAPRWWTVATITLALGTAAMAVTGLWRLLALGPSTPSDAVMIWNLKARFLMHAETWTELLRPEIGTSHPDYPLLLPMAVARAWQALGEEAAAAPAVLAGVFAVGTLVVLGGVVATLRGLPLGLLAVVFATSCTAWVWVGPRQLADIPLAFYFLGGQGALLIASRCAERGDLAAEQRVAVLAGFLLGCAAWTKNEGAVWLGCTLVARTWSMHGQGPRRSLAAQLPLLAGGAAPLACLVVFKVGYAPTNDLVSLTTVGSVAERLTSWHRFEVVAAGLWREISLMAPRGIWALPLFVVLAGRARDPRDWPGLRALALALAMMFAAVFAFYVLTPHELEWHLRTSAQRLFAQLWPTAILLAFVAARDPGASELS